VVGGGVWQQPALPPIRNEATNLNETLASIHTGVTPGKRDRSSVVAPGSACGSAAQHPRASIEDRPRHKLPTGPTPDDE